eukprot:scaffold195477_cov21-Tisochrysis_lutea.AAC.2
MIAGSKSGQNAGCEYGVPGNTLPRLVLKPRQKVLLGSLKNALFKDKSKPRAHALCACLPAGSWQGEGGAAIPPALARAVAHSTAVCCVPIRCRFSSRFYEHSTLRTHQLPLHLIGLAMWQLWQTSLVMVLGLAYQMISQRWVCNANNAAAPLPAKITHYSCVWSQIVRAFPFYVAAAAVPACTAAACTDAAVGTRHEYAYLRVRAWARKTRA